MKSIFKKIAFVLALAMVVTAFPAKTAAAADGPQVVKKRVLYIDGDVTGQYADSAYASVWNKDGYSVTFASENEKVATVKAKGGKIQAVSVGETVVTATFSKDGAEDIVKKCTVVVKQNAGAVVLEETSAELVVGDTYTIKAAAKNENNTDAIHFARKDKTSEVISVNYNTGEITAKEAGTATVLVYATMPVYNKETGKTTTKVTTEKVEFTVTVKEPSIQVQQTASDAFEIVFPNKEAADAAVKNTLPSINKAEAAVTENKEIVKVFQVLQAATEQTEAVETYVFIRNLTAKDNVVTVTMMNELKEETAYAVRYQDNDTTFTTCKNVAAKLTSWNQEIGGSRTENSVEVAVRFDIWAVGENGQDVKITGSKAYGNGDWEGSVNIEDLAAEYDASYVFSGNTVWFYTNNADFKVNLKASFEDWYVVEGSEAKTLTCLPVVTPGNTQVKIGNILQWGVVKLGDNNAYNVQKLAVEDAGYRLAVEASINNYGKDEKVSTNKGDLANDGFTFVSSNDDKLSVNEQTGEIYPPKAAVSNVLIHVYYKDVYVGSCPVTVVAKRTFSRLVVTGSGNLAYGKNFTDSANIAIQALDQLETGYAGVSIEATFADTNQSTYVALGANGLTGGDGKYTISVEPTTNAPATATPVRIVITATYTTEDGKEIVKKSSVSFTVKNTSASTDVASYKLVPGAHGAVMDEALYMPNLRWSWPSVNGIADKTLDVRAYSVDKQGYKIEQLALSAIGDDSFGSGSTLSENNVEVLIKKGTETFDGTGNDFVIDDDNNGRETVTGGKLTFTVVTVSESGITKSYVKNADLGNYVVSLFVGNSSDKAVYKCNQVLVVKNTQDKPTFKWVNSTVTDGTVEQIAQNALELYFDQDRDGTLETWSVDNVTVDIIAADISRVGNKATIKSVTYEWEVCDYDGVAQLDGNNSDAPIVVEFVVPINRTVTIAD